MGPRYLHEYRRILSIQAEVWSLTSFFLRGPLTESLAILWKRGFANIVVGDELHGPLVDSTILSDNEKNRDKNFTGDLRYESPEVWQGCPPPWVYVGPPKRRVRPWNTCGGSGERARKLAYPHSVSVAPPIGGRSARR